MEELKPAAEVIEKMGLDVGSRLLLIGDVQYYREEMIEAVQPAPTLKSLSLSISLPVPTSSADFVLAWFLRKLPTKVFISELDRITSPKGKVWVVVWSEDSAPMGSPVPYQVQKIFETKEREKLGEIKLSKDYIAIGYGKKIT